MVPTAGVGRYATLAPARTAPAAPQRARTGAAIALAAASPAGAYCVHNCLPHLGACQITFLPPLPNMTIEAAEVE